MVFDKYILFGDKKMSKNRKIFEGNAKKYAEAT